MAKEREFVKELADITQDLPQWYTDVVLKTELVDYGPVRGTMVIRPYGYAIWELIQAELNARFKATGHRNAYFPMLIPESYLRREAEHVEGFAPEVAVVTHAGGEQLTEPLIVRPTSETIICEMYAKWVQSYRDLPVLLNQWANVVRWEKTTRPFLRTSEFLWQEGHTLHATEEEAREETMQMLEVYREFAENVLAIPVYVGIKTEREKFAGAVDTYGMEAMMLDGKSLQAGTSHYLGQNFAKAFGMKFLDKDGVHKLGYSTSWGVSTRLIGALIMAHGDSRGLMLPPKAAPVQAVILPIAGHKGGVNEKALELEKLLQSSGIRAEADLRDYSAGWKFNEWEMKGVPLRIEIGPRDIERGEAVLVLRHSGEKKSVPLLGIENTVIEHLELIQSAILEKARAHRDSRTKTAHSFEEFSALIDGGNFVRGGWCGLEKCEESIKEQTAATARVIPFNDDLSAAAPKTCVCCGKPSKHKVLFARAY